MARKKHILKRLNRLWLEYEYKHTTLAVLSIWLFILLVDSALIAAIFGFIEDLGYVGGLIAGALSISFVTAAPAVILLLDLSNKLDPHVLALCWAVGSTLGDWVTVRFYEDGVFKELQPILRRFKIKSVVRIMRHRFTSWILFLIGAVVVASPLPDEVGLGLMGMSKIKKPYIVFMCFLLNILGAMVVILAVRAIEGG
jgi:hypothetical protein